MPMWLTCPSLGISSISDSVIGCLVDGIQSYDCPIPSTPRKGSERRRRVLAEFLLW